MNIDVTLTEHNWLVRSWIFSLTQQVKLAVPKGNHPWALRSRVTMKWNTTTQSSEKVCTLKPTGITGLIRVSLVIVVESSPTRR